MPQCLTYYTFLNGQVVGGDQQGRRSIQVPEGETLNSSPNDQRTECTVVSVGDRQDVTYRVYLRFTTSEFLVFEETVSYSFSPQLEDLCGYLESYGLGAWLVPDIVFDNLPICDAPPEPETPPNNAAYHFCITCNSNIGVKTFQYTVPLKDPDNFLTFGNLGTHGSNVVIHGNGLGGFYIVWQESIFDNKNTQTFNVPDNSCSDMPLFYNGTQMQDCISGLVDLQTVPTTVKPNCNCSCFSPPSFQTPATGLQVGSFGNIVSTPCSGSGCTGSCLWKQAVIGINNDIAIWSHIMGGIGGEGTGKNCQCGTETTPDPCGSATWCWNEPMKCIAWSVCQNAQVGCDECKGNQYIFKKKIPLSIYNKLTGKDPSNLNSTIWVNNGGVLSYYFAQGQADPNDPDATPELGEKITDIELPGGCCGDRALHVVAVECDCDADPVQDCGLEELTPNPAATTCQPGVDCLVLPCRGCDKPYCEPHDPPPTTTPDNRPWGFSCINNSCVLIQGGAFSDGFSCAAAGCLFNPPDENPHDDPPPPPPPDPENPTTQEPPQPQVKIICLNGSCIEMQSSSLESSIGEDGQPLVSISGFSSMDECISSGCQNYGRYLYQCVPDFNTCIKILYDDKYLGSPNIYQSPDECDLCLSATTTTTAEPTTTTEGPTSTTTAEPTTTTPCPGDSVLAYVWVFDSELQCATCYQTQDTICAGTINGPELDCLFQVAGHNAENCVTTESPTTTTESPTTTAEPTTTEGPTTTACPCFGRIEFLWVANSPNENNECIGGQWTATSSCDGSGCSPDLSQLPNGTTCTDHCGPCWISVDCICT